MHDPMSTPDFDDPFDDTPEASDTRIADFALCACGCHRDEHDDSGRCRYCLEEDCGGYTYDEESTVLALASMDGEKP